MLSSFFLILVTFILGIKTDSTATPDLSCIKNTPDRVGFQFGLKMELWGPNYKNKFDVISSTKTGNCELLCSWHWIIGKLTLKIWSSRVRILKHKSLKSGRVRVLNAEEQLTCQNVNCFLAQMSGHHQPSCQIVIMSSGSGIFNQIFSQIYFSFQSIFARKFDQICSILIPFISKAFCVCLLFHYTNQMRK